MAGRPLPEPGNGGKVETGGWGSPPEDDADVGRVVVVGELGVEIGGSDSVELVGTPELTCETGRGGMRKPPSAGADLEIGVSPER